MPTTPLTPDTSPSPVERDVVVSQHVLQGRALTIIEGKRASRDAIAFGACDLVEPSDEAGLDLAVRSMMALSPGFAAHVRGEL